MNYVEGTGRVLKRMLSRERKRTYALDEGGVTPDRKLLSAKGAALCELTNAGLPVPPGFVITTENFTEYVNHGEVVRDDLLRAIKESVHDIERETGRLFGHGTPDKKKLPLFLAVRAGAAIIVPGQVVLYHPIYLLTVHIRVMDTVLNVGITDSTVEYIIAQNPGHTRFALDLHRRFLYSFGTLVQRNNAIRYQRVLATARDMDRVDSNDQLTVDGLTYVVGEFRTLTKAPDDPYEQLRMIVEAMYQHGFSPRFASRPSLPSLPCPVP